MVPWDVGRCVIVWNMGFKLTMITFSVEDILDNEGMIRFIVRAEIERENGTTVYKSKVALNDGFVITKNEIYGNEEKDTAYEEKNSTKETAYEEKDADIESNTIRQS